jgi:hypothetical protein
MPHPLAPDPRNDDDFDTWAYGTEPVPGDTTWAPSPHDHPSLNPSMSLSNLNQRNSLSPVEVATSPTPTPLLDDT